MPLPFIAPPTTAISALDTQEDALHRPETPLGRLLGGQSQTGVHGSSIPDSILSSILGDNSSNALVRIRCFPSHNMFPRTRIQSSNFQQETFPAHCTSRLASTWSAADHGGPTQRALAQNALAAMQFLDNSLAHSPAVPFARCAVRAYVGLRIAPEKKTVLAHQLGRKVVRRSAPVIRTIYTHIDQFGQRDALL